MKDKAIDPRRIDVRSFARDAGAISGQWALATMHRLGQSCEPALADAEMPAVTWSARGELRSSVGGVSQTWLRLDVHATVRLQCQRCMLPLSETLAAQRSFLFARDEVEATRLDEEIDDDVLVMARSLDLAELAEDELILALPLVPRHESCPEPLVVASESVAAAPERPNPFAALAALRRSPGSQS